MEGQNGRSVLLRQWRNININKSVLVTWLTRSAHGLSNECSSMCSLQGGSSGERGERVIGNDFDDYWSIGTCNY